MDIQRLVIANPSGNITAIVLDETPRAKMHDVGLTIQSAYPNVEQVLFVEHTPHGVHGQMAGGEFCGNAARALGFLLANSRDGKCSFTMSGSAEPVTVKVSGDQATLVARMDVNRINADFYGAMVDIVHLEGITHAVMTQRHPLYQYFKENAAKPNRWQTVVHALEDLAIKDEPASGLILAECNGDSLTIAPYVYVSGNNTLYPEQACASGSIAAAFVACSSECLARGASIAQPSGENLLVSLKLNGAKPEIRVTGKMSIVYDGQALGMEYSAASLHGRLGELAPSPIGERDSSGSVLTHARPQPPVRRLG
jgi:diaminopimelate epimerase